MCDYEERGTSSWHFDPDDIGPVLSTFLIPYSFESDTRQYFEQMKWPELIAIAPSQGPALGGTLTIIDGGDFSERASQLDYLFCKFDTAVVKASLISTREISCIAPKHSSKLVTVEVTMNNQQYTNSAVRFEYTTSQLTWIELGCSSDHFVDFHCGSGA